MKKLFFLITLLFSLSALCSAQTITDADIDRFYDEAPGYLKWNPIRAANRQAVREWIMGQMNNPNSEVYAYFNSDERKSQTEMDHLIPPGFRDNAKKRGEYIAEQLDIDGSPIQKYFESKGQQADPSSAGAAIGQGGGWGDEISNEIDQILGESGQQIMSGIKNAIMDEITGAIGSFLGASPVAEVAKLKSMVKDGYSQAQKIAYQDYKLEYAEQKANMELSSDFINYYNKLNLKGKLKNLNENYDKGRKLASSNLLNSYERTKLLSLLQEASDVKDIEGDIKTVVNKGSKAVWMNEANRVTILNESAQEIEARNVNIASINKQIANMIEARYQSAITRANRNYLLKPTTR